ncbi:MAG: hypothetical protein N4A35_08335 [Flavobacteriales bacterium]|nr:hypothetical protein [Flavobacteriales bacterium]
MSCNKATLLIEKSKVISLSFKEILSLKMHLAMCSACSNYNKLSRQLDELFEKIGEEDLKSMELSDAKKKEILSVIKDFEA